jgi:GT2 family glycosyltransferase
MDAVILSVHDRPEIDLLKTLDSVAKNDLENTRVLVIDDGSEQDYARVSSFFSGRMEIEWRRVDTVKERPNTYNIDGHNNPAYVNNYALELTEDCDRLFWLSSDCILPPHALKRAREYDLEQVSWLPRVIDLHGGKVWNGAHKPWPMMWFVATSRVNCVKCGGFDEKYLDGIGFEDNDFMGRIFIQSGRLVIDDKVTVYHQSHEQVAYSDDWSGFKASETYTLEKWGGAVPFRQNGDPLLWQPFTTDEVCILSLTGLNAKATEMAQVAA